MTTFSFFCGKMFVGLHADLRIDVCCGDYILHLGWHEVYTFARICIFSFKAMPFSQKYKFFSLLFYLYFTRVLHFVL